jgi:hypothetical protein
MHKCAPLLLFLHATHPRLFELEQGSVNPLTGDLRSFSDPESEQELRLARPAINNWQKEAMRQKTES